MSLITKKIRSRVFRRLMTDVNHTSCLDAPDSVFGKMKRQVVKLKDMKE